MKFFVSSVIGDFASRRDAACAAIQSLGHQALRCEHYTASPSSPRVACLSGVRDADAVVLLLGARYGAPQTSGRSATHEEFDEARGSKPVFAFIEAGVAREEKQAELVRLVQDWNSGNYTANFTSEASLRDAVTAAIHRWELTNATARVDPEEMRRRVLASLPTQERQRYVTEPTLVTAVVGAPRQPILRPSHSKIMSSRIS